MRSMPLRRSQLIGGINMKQNLQFKEAEITVYCGENARINTKSSLRQALGLSVIVYSQAPRTGEKGKIVRGGLGKLAVIADEIIKINTEELEREEREIAMSSRRKINELSYAHSESGVNEGGKLILPAAEFAEEVFHESELMEV